jgi:CheY-like chemotaxis protein
MNVDALSTSSNEDDAYMVPIYLQRNRLKVGLICPLSLRSAFRMAIAANYPALSVVTILPKPFFADSICNTLLSLIPTSSSPVPSTSSTPFTTERETLAEEENVKAEVLAENLPASQSEVPSSNIVQPTLPVEVAEVPRARILMVEDNMVNQLVQKKMVTQLGCLCEVANNGQEGLSLFQTQSASLSQHSQLHYQHPQQLHADDSQHSTTSGSGGGTGRKTAYDLVLMDCQMPIMNGFDATMEIRQYERQCHLEHTHIIGLTAGKLKTKRSTIILHCIVLTLCCCF